MATEYEHVARVIVGNQRRTIRAEVNEMDRCTVVSIFPKDIPARNSFIQPGNFLIKAGSLENPSLLVVGSSSWWKEVPDDPELFEVPVPSKQVANSIVNDHVLSMWKSDPQAAHPGVFWVAGEHNKESIFKNYRQRLEHASKMQKAWYEALVTETDALWAQHNGNPKVVLADAKLAALELNLRDKLWMKDHSTLKMVECPACGALRKTDFPICAACKTIVDEKRYKELGLKQAV